MNFLADMGISMSTVTWLQSLGHDVVHVRQIKMQASSDEAILTFARDQKRIVLTCDLDFGALMAASGGNLPSVIIFRLDNERPENINVRLDAVLTASEKELEDGCVVSVEDKNYRVRHLPIKPIL